MSPLYSGLILMTVGAFFAGGAYVTFVYGSQG